MTPFQRLTPRNATLKIETPPRYLVATLPFHLVAFRFLVFSMLYAVKRHLTPPLAFQSRWWWRFRGLPPLRGEAPNAPIAPSRVGGRFGCWWFGAEFVIRFSALHARTEKEAESNLQLIERLAVLSPNAVSIALDADVRQTGPCANKASRLTQERTDRPLGRGARRTPVAPAQHLRAPGRAKGRSMFGLKREDRVVIVSREEWDLAKVEIRGLKRLADLEAQERKEQNARFAGAIDTLEARINEIGALLATVAASQERATTEFVNRLQRAETAIGDAANARATDVALAFDRIDELERREPGVSGAQIASLEMELATLSERLEAQKTALLAVAGDVTLMRTQQTAPSLADIAAAAPVPDLEEMRKFYAEKRAQKEAAIAATSAETWPVREVTLDAAPARTPPEQTVCDADVPAPEAGGEFVGFATVANGHAAEERAQREPM